MTDRWVNARIEILVPLDGVTPDSGPYAKQDAVSAVVDALLDRLTEAQANSWAIAGFAEDVESDCTTADCEGRTVGQVEIEEGWFPYCQGCLDVLFGAGHQVRRRAPEPALEEL